MLEVPCSRVAHTFRAHYKYRNKPGVDFVAHNFKRIAEVWLDEYKEYLYIGDPKRYSKVDAGDLTREKLIRKNLNCKPFKYFLDHIAPEMLERYPIHYLGIFAKGAIQSEADTAYCVAAINGPQNKSLGLNRCHENLKNPGPSQDFVFSWHRQIKINDEDFNCFDSYEKHPFIKECNFTFGNQLWFYDLVSLKFISKPIYFNHVLLLENSSIS